MVQKVYFLDVGQGTSSVIQLEDNRFIVIDTGPKGAADWLAEGQTHPLLDVIAESGGKAVIEALIISHSHDDHYGALDPLLNSPYVEEIKAAFYTKDSSKDAEVPLSLLRTSWEDPKGKLKAEPLPLELQDSSEPSVIYSSNGEQGKVLLTLLHPSAEAAQSARKRNAKNAGCAILALRVGTHRIVFPGDVPDDAIHNIRDLYGRALPASVVAVPHHGGKVWTARQRKNETDKQFSQRVIDDLVNMYSRDLVPELAVISVGSANGYRHPMAEVLDALRCCEVPVMCTQMTKKCWIRDLHAARVHTLAGEPPEFPGISTRRQRETSKGNVRDVGCASTVVASFADGRMRIRRGEKHRDVISDLRGHPDGRPSCI
ncbi:MAG: ComEC/Rec2 family competence protein [Planctomycetota bacterium]|jgi:beta-lactamase superfamily II metal-dependent hydrolase